MGSAWSQESYIKAYRFAAEAHQGQLFPGTELPYLMHVSLVCMEVIAALAYENDLDGDLAIQCALLHDVIEDTAVTFEMLAAGFGEDIANGVLALTKDETLPKEEQMRDSLERILEQPAEIGMVKLSDRITNLMRPPTYWTRAKKEAYQLEALEIHDTLCDSSEFLSQRLLEKIEGYKEYF
jgi:(p)ppGpp synthase/HD superfamily hydrolase